MATSGEPMYCSQQISIPPELPNILKQFTKAAIRTQPSDALQVFILLVFVDFFLLNLSVNKDAYCPSCLYIKYYPGFFLSNSFQF